MKQISLDELERPAGAKAPYEYAASEIGETAGFSLPEGDKVSISLNGVYDILLIITNKYLAHINLFIRS